MMKTFSGRELCPSDLKTHYIDARLTSAPAALADRLEAVAQKVFGPEASPVFVCIGTDRVPGDSLGPLVGSRLFCCGDFPCPVYGTLEFPIHALNLTDAMHSIKCLHPQNPIVAVDASLGTRRHQNHITVTAGGLLPGAGVNKRLMEVGDLSITGITGPSGSRAQLTLQSTRLTPVLALADCIFRGILLYARR